MTRLDWWLGVAVLAAALLFHSIFPRYEVRPGENIARFDRWTGNLEIAGKMDRVPWLTIYRNRPE
jgi:hypothetical protein